MKQLPGLRFDTLTVFGSRYPEIAYDAIDGMIRDGYGWKARRTWKQKEIAMRGTVRTRAETRMKMSDGEDHSVVLIERKSLPTRGRSEKVNDHRINLYEREKIADRKLEVVKARVKGHGSATLAFLHHGDCRHSVENQHN